jgi:hypothetical protein
VPAWSWRQSSLTWRLSPTRLDFRRLPIISSFLLNPCIVHNSGTSILAKDIGPKQTSVGVEQLMPILDRTDGRNLLRMEEHSFSEKHVAPKGYLNFWRIIVVKPVLVLSRFIGVWRRRGWSLVASFRQYSYSVLLFLVGARQTPKVHLPLLTSMHLMDWGLVLWLS